ncbi:MAG: radical SAM protein, partial [Eudoraea sp.]|nr:radical SAM protein [Eudoraea sp.]
DALPFTGSVDWPYTAVAGKRKDRAINSSQSRMISGHRKSWAHFKLKVTLLRILIREYNNPLDWIRGLQFLIKLRRRFLGDHSLKKMALVDGKYYMGLFTPGWPGKVHDRFIASELNNFKRNTSSPYRFNHVFLAITKKCALRCEHCYEWDSLNKKEVLSEEALHTTIERIQELGTAQIHFTGGEPMLKLDMMRSLMKKASFGSNFWMNTSGLKLTHTHAQILKAAGLTGVFISLDHYMPEEHNSFRNYKDAFYWALEGAKNAKNNGLVVAFSVCMRKDFVTVENVLQFMELAKKTGVHFVQFLEPKAVGHYKDVDVSLRKDQIELLETTFLKMNFSDNYSSYPIITYHGYYQRRQGCFSAGKRGVYIDTDGDINPCTFCHKKSGNILDDDMENKLATMSDAGCPSYNL